MSENPVNSPETVVDPVVLLEVGDETYQLIYDFKVAKEICRWTGYHPTIQGLNTAMCTPDGLEICLWACLTKMGKGNDIPQEQRNIKLEEVKEWFEVADSDTVDKFALAIVAAWEKSRSKNKKDVPPDPNSSPQTLIATT